MNNNLIEEAKSYIKKIFENDYSGHDYYHTIRVYELATTIARKENADVQIVQLAALLHDVDDRKLSPATYEKKDNARSFLEEHNLTNSQISLICDIIGEISFAGKDSVTPKTIEGKCVQDADRLDAIGAIGIARAFSYGGNRNRKMYDPQIKPIKDISGKQYVNNHNSTTINHFYEKLLLLKNSMNTKTAQEIATRRDKYMREFLDEFFSEWNGRS